MNSIEHRFQIKFMLGHLEGIYPLVLYRFQQLSNSNSAHMKAKRANIEQQVQLVEELTTLFKV